MVKSYMFCPPPPYPQFSGTWRFIIIVITIIITGKKKSQPPLWRWLWANLSEFGQKKHRFSMCLEPWNTPKTRQSGHWAHPKSILFRPKTISIAKKKSKKGEKTNNRSYGVLLISDVILNVFRGNWRWLGSILGVFNLRNHHFSTFLMPWSFKNNGFNGVSPPLKIFF